MWDSSRIDRYTPDVEVPQHISYAVGLENMDAKTDGESRIGETEYDEFTAELNTADSKDEHIKDAEKETDEQG